MESSSSPLTPDEASATLADAEAGRASLANDVVVPTFFFVSLGIAVAIQIATTAAGLAGASDSPGWLVAVGIAIFVVVSAVLLLRFRAVNGVWLGGLVSHVIGGTATAASVSYAAALGGGVWAASEGAWWLVTLCAAAGGTAYALSGVAWMRRYRSEPAAHSRGESAAWLAVLLVLAVAGAVLLVSLR